MSFPLAATSPLPWAVLILLLLALAWGRLQRGWRMAGVLVELALLVAMTPFGARLLARAVVARMPAAAVCAAPLPRTIVVLAAGFANQPVSATDYAALQPVALHRVFTGVDLWRALPPGARLVMTGGGNTGTPESMPMAALAQQLGVPGGAIAVETTSRDTWQSARNVAALAPAVPKRIWLVTSALHMPRALGAFRAWGFAPCPWPSDLAETALRFGPGMFIPSSVAVDASRRALHELAGAVDYAWLEWRHRRATPAARRQTP